MNIKGVHVQKPCPKFAWTTRPASTFQKSSLVGGDRYDGSRAPGQGPDMLSPFPAIMGYSF